MFSPPTFPAGTACLPSVSRAYGEGWCLEKRSLVLIVPSIVARLDANLLINPAHPEVHRIEASLHRPVYWDRRLFGATI